MSRMPDPQRNVWWARCAAALAATTLATVSHAQEVTPPEARAPLAGQRDGGFVLATELGALFTLFGLGAQGTSFPWAVPGGAVGLGFKSGRFIGTLGLDLTNLTLEAKTAGTGPGDRYTMFQFSPLAQIALARSADRRVELPLALGLGAGTAIIKSSPDSPPAIFSYRIEPGVRFWAHPQLAVQLLAGYGGTWSVATNDNARTFGLNGAVAHLGAIGVF